LLAAEELANFEIEKSTGFSAPMVLKWRDRYLLEGFDGLNDAPRPGREPEIVLYVTEQHRTIVSTRRSFGHPAGIIPG